jgi:nucleotide-binding universal stress UspA family protein
MRERTVVVREARSHAPAEEGSVMGAQDIEQARTVAGSRVVVVIGVDLSDVSEHLLQTARDLVRQVDEPDLHVVHVVRPDPLPTRLAVPLQSMHIAERANLESANWELERLCRSILGGGRGNVTIHTPVGGAADELIRIATEVKADVVVIEAHERAGRRHLLGRSVVARIAARAPCSVVAVRRAAVPYAGVSRLPASAPLSKTEVLH